MPADPLPTCERRARHVAWLLAGLAALWLTGLWSLELGQPIYDDEIPFVRAARVINVPDPSRYVIPHPPLVVHMLSAARALPLPEDRAMRVVGLSAAWATLALLPLAGRVLLPAGTSQERAAGWLTGGLAALLYAAAPLALQGAGLLDIDNTWLTPLTLAPFVGYFAVRGTAGRLRPALRSAAPVPAAPILALGALLALALWAKWLTTPFVPLALVLYALFARNRRALREVLAATLLGALLFAGTFLLYSALLQFPIDQFGVTFSKSSDVGGPGAMAQRALQGGGILLFWLTPPLAVLWAVESLRAGLRLLRGRPLPLDALALFAWALLVFYLFIRELPYGFPRYHVPMLPALALMCAWPVAAAVLRARRRDLAVALGLLLVAFACAWLVGDPLLPQYRLTSETTALAQRLRAALVQLLRAALLPLALVAAGWSAYAWLRRREGVLRPWMVQAALVLLIAGLGASLGLDVVQARADYALRYSYGREGAWDVVARVRAPGAPAGRIVAPQEILYESARDGWTHYSLFCPRCLASDFLAVLGRRPAFVILTDKEQRRYTQVTGDAQVLTVLAQCYRRAIIGSYITFERTCAAP